MIKGKSKKINAERLWENNWVHTANESFDKFNNWVLTNKITNQSTKAKEYFFDVSQELPIMLLRHKSYWIDSNKRYHAVIQPYKDSVYEKYLPKLIEICSEIGIDVTCHTSDKSWYYPNQCHMIQLSFPRNMYKYTRKNRRYVL